MSTFAWKAADISVTTSIALVVGALSWWWFGGVVFVVGLLIVLWPKEGLETLFSAKGQRLKKIHAGDWLEEWHDDMRRWQIGPYEWRD